MGWWIVKNCRETRETHPARDRCARARADGFAVGALRLVRANGLWSLFQLVNNAGAGDRLITGDGGDIVAFLDGMIAAANVSAVARRRVILPGETA
jgi:hypothetical protein